MGFVLASLKFPLSPAYSNTIFHKEKCTVTAENALRHHIDSFCMYLVSSSSVPSLFIYAQS